MEQNIQISKLNDFIFCPKSLYFHSIYDDFNKKMYHRTAQTVGSIKHETIDESRYSSKNDILQGSEIYSNKYGLAGKIDIFDKRKGELVERKYKIRKIYDGYKLQLYAQYYCLVEMGYNVKKLYLHSLSDNKRYEIKLPDENEARKLENLLKQINDYNYDSKIEINPEKCKQCIYSELCI